MGGGSHGDVEEGEGLEERPPPVEYFGWVYHLGVNSIGHEYCHLRFLHLKGKHVNMYKRDPHENPSTKPTRRGTIGHTLKLEELGRKKINNGDLYVMRFYDRLDESKKGEIACATAGETRKWMEAFDQAKQQAEYELSIGSSRHKLSEINLERHARVRRYANGLKRLIKIGKGPEVLLRQSLDRSDGYFERDETDAVEAHEWKCIRTVDGIRIFEDVTSSKGDKGCLVKSVGVVDASIDTVFEVICSLDRRKRYEWDTLNSDLELVESVDGHYDIIYGTYDLKYLKGYNFSDMEWANTNHSQPRWHTKRDFVFSRQWFHGEDGSYTILHFPASHKSRPSKSGYQRTKIISSIWEIRRLDPLPTSSANKCLVMQMFEINSSGWVRWKNHSNARFEKTIHYGLLNQVAGLKAYIAANPNLKTDSSIAVVRHSMSSESVDFEDNDANEEFYDAIAVDGFLEDEDSDESDEEDDDPSKGGKVKLKNVSWAIARLAVKKSSALVADTELDTQSHPIDSDASEFHGSMRQAKDETDANCWTVPSGQGFMIRGKTYLKDLSKVAGGDPLLKLLAVDWLTADKNVDQIALSPKCLVQSEAGKKLPFILVVNLQVPAKPNYSLVLYFGADRPVNEGSLLSKFIDGNDMFRDARFKLIPSIVEGYWMVKRAVGSKACLLGKAVTCRYLRLDNFLEIDVDIGSSSVARSIIGLVLGYVTSLVVDLAILIEGKEEEELPEYLLGTVRLSHVRLESAVPF